MPQNPGERSPQHTGHVPSQSNEPVVLGLWGVRYQVKDVSRSIAFYTDKLGFTLDKQNLPAFAQVSVGAGWKADPIGRSRWESD